MEELLELYAQLLQFLSHLASVEQTIQAQIIHQQQAIKEVIRFLALCECHKEDRILISDVLLLICLFLFA